jgi:hypothetical protein
VRSFAAFALRLDTIAYEHIMFRDGGQVTRASFDGSMIQMRGEALTLSHPEPHSSPQILPLGSKDRLLKFTTTSPSEPITF